MNVSPVRCSNTISSSSSPTRIGFACVPARNTPYVPRSGIVPPFRIAIFFTPPRGVIQFRCRSHVTRGRNSANSSDGYRPASISSTPSNTASLSPAYGAALRTSASSAS